MLAHQDTKLGVDQASRCCNMLGSAWRGLGSQCCAAAACLLGTLCCADAAGVPALCLLRCVSQQLDKQMHKMMHEKHTRQEQIRANQAAIDRIDATIRTNIQPCLVST